MVSLIQAPKTKHEFIWEQQSIELILARKAKAGAPEPNCRVVYFFIVHIGCLFYYVLFRILVYSMLSGLRRGTPDRAVLLRKFRAGLNLYYTHVNIYYTHIYIGR